MILILLSWIYIFFTAGAFGIVFSKVMRIQQFDLVRTTILGLFSITILATIFAFFGPISFLFHSILFLLSGIFWYQNKETFASIFQNSLLQIRSFAFPVKIFLGLTSLLIAIQSAALPFIIDNESYYIQTVKWLNEYGFVKGLANLHLFFGQTSGWHITQSVYSFSFLYDRFNDINGFCLLLGNFFAFQKLHAFFTKGHQLDLVFGLLPLTYAFLFQFVSSPSPDLPVYIFGFILFGVYLQNDDDIKNRFAFISILVLYTVFIKVTAVILLLFPLILLLKNFRTLQRVFLKIMLVGSLVLLLFVLKNLTLTGYPLFPLLCFRIDAFDYTVPAIIMDFFFSKSMLHSFYMPFGSYPDASVSFMIKQYFFHNGLTGYIGILSLFLLVFMPYVIIKKHLSKSIWTVYFAFVVLGILLFLSSPQYRFYIYFTLFFLLLLLSPYVSKQTTIIRLYVLNIILLGVMVFIPISFNKLTDNKLLGQNSTFRFINAIIPEPNSRWSDEYRGGSVGNMHYHSPIDTSFFWVTGNGELPCINTTQLDYFHKGFFFIPQQRSIELKNGFYAQKVSGDE